MKLFYKLFNDAVGMVRSRTKATEFSLVFSLFNDAITNSDYTASSDQVAIRNIFEKLERGRVWSKLSYYPGIFPEGLGK